MKVEITPTLFAIEGIKKPLKVFLTLGGSDKKNNERIIGDPELNLR